MRAKALRSGGTAVDVGFCLVFPREALSVPVMRRVLGDTLSRLGFGQSCIDDLLLAVTEACTNVLLHAGPGRQYELVVHVDGSQCVLEVVDSGRGFEPVRAGIRRPMVRPSVRPGARLRRRPTSPGYTAPVAPVSLRNRISGPRRLARERAVAELPESGRGLAIMRACVDDVTLRSRPGHGTVVCMQKQIEWRSDAPLSLLPASQLRDAG
jgi:serine/threonine-protein kinase RsbW